MSLITKLKTNVSIIALFVMIAAHLAGCSDPNPQAIVNPDTGSHPANWSVDHRTSYLINPGPCAECHGSNLRGGISGVSCFSADFKGLSCHAAGPSGHPVGWGDPASHGAAAKAAPDADTGFERCRLCHGPDFSGGVAGASCFTCHGVNAPHSPAPWRGGTRSHTNANTGNAAVCGVCHAGQSPTPAPPGTPVSCFNNTLCHGDAAAAHVVPFTSPTLHGPAAKSDLIVCQQCHATPSTGGAGSNPQFNVMIGSLAAGCEDCHPPNTAHPKPWYGLSAGETGHQSAGNTANACSLCHGVNLAGGAGPACSSCHTSGSPLTALNCASCHGKPPAGASAPNREGAHAEHNALPDVANVCGACHDGAGTGTAAHFNGAVNVAFLGTTYQGKGGTATYNAAGFSCSNVSCHGGPRTQTSAQAGQNPPASTPTQTPDWLAGTINVNTQCAACHVLGPSAGNPENNSYFSGRHRRHVYSQAIACTACHDTTSLATNHFTNPATPEFEGSPAATINAGLQYNGMSCNPQAGGLTGCHGGKNWW